MRIPPKIELFTTVHLRTIALVASIVAVVGIATTTFFAIRAAQSSSPQVSAVDANRELLSAVGKIITLPVGETPVIATVADPAQLRAQPFFQNAQKGDKVLLYSAARKAVLYRPSENRLIDVAPWNPGSSATP